MRVVCIFFVFDWHCLVWTRWCGTNSRWGNYFD